MTEELIIQILVMVIGGGWWIYIGHLLIKLIKQTNPNERT